MKRNKLSRQADVRKQWLERNLDRIHSCLNSRTQYLGYPFSRYRSKFVNSNQFSLRRAYHNQHSYLNWPKKAKLLRKVQDIFTRVINAKFYPCTSYRHSSNYMCNALKSAERQGVVTAKEVDFARKVISKYLGGYNSLYSLLEANNYFTEIVYNLPFNMSFKEIYLNWSNRPLGLNNGCRAIY